MWFSCLLSLVSVLLLLSGVLSSLSADGHWGSISRSLRTCILPSLQIHRAQWWSLPREHLCSPPGAAALSSALGKAGWISDVNTWRDKGQIDVHSAGVFSLGEKVPRKMDKLECETRRHISGRGCYQKRTYLVSRACPCIAEPGAQARLGTLLLKPCLLLV